MSLQSSVASKMNFARRQFGVVELLNIPGGVSMSIRILCAAAVCALFVAAGPGALAQGARAPKAERKLAEALSGRTAGEPVACIRENARMTVIDDSTILFRDRGVVYLQQPQGACRGLSRGMSLVRNTTGASRMCRGDLNSVVDIGSGYGTEACVFNDFVPYQKAK